MLRNLTPGFDLFFFMAITFVGDYSVFNFPAFYIVWSSLIIYRLTTNSSISRQEFSVQILCTFLFIIYLLLIFRSLSFYDNHIPFMILYINAIPLLERIIASKRNNYPWLLLSITGLFGLYLIYQGNLRQSLIFGPNILYRIYGVIFFIGYFINMAQQKKINISLYLAISFLIFSLMGTGSRGGTIVLILTLLIIIKDLKGMIAYTVYLTIFSMFAYLLSIYWSVIYPLLWRLVYFDINNASEAGRLFYYINFKKFLDEKSIFNLIFGLGSQNRIYSFYPHSVILENIVSNGLYFSLIITMSALRSMYIFIVNQKSKKILICYSPIIIGSLLSGNALDNYTTNAVLIFVALTSMNITRTNKRDLAYGN